MKKLMAGLVILGCTYANLVFAGEAKVDSKAGAPQKKILFVRSGTESFTSVFEAMKKDLKKYRIDDYVVSKDTNFKDFEKKLKETPSDLLILMDNKAVEMATQFNKGIANPKEKRIGVALMALNLKGALAGQEWASGISFEVPAFTLLTEFRSTVEKPIKNVLVMYRKSIFQQSIVNAKEQLAMEGINLDAIDVESTGKSQAKYIDLIERNLKAITVDGQAYDAVWVMLDSALMAPNIFLKAWIPAARTNQLPFVSGVEEFVSNDLKFCAFALTPSLPNLAIQASQMVEAILDKNMPPSELGIEEVLSVNKIVNMNRMKDLGLKLRKGALSEAKIIE